MNPPSRRDFLHMTGGSLLWLHLDPHLRHLTRQTARTRQVHLHTFDPAATPPDAAVQDALRAATDLSWLQPGDSVFLKVACNSNYGPPAVTSPAVIPGVVQALQAAGAGPIYVGDMSGALFVRHLPDETIGSTRENMRQNGLLTAAEDAGAQVFCFEEVPYAEAYVPGIPTGAHHWGDDLFVAEILDRVDHIINLPRLGKHVLAGASLGLKNAVGWISDHSRMVLHRDAATFHEKIAEINTIPQLADKTRLTLTLVDHALTTYGPDSGYQLPLAQPLIVASDDIVSHDQIALLTLLWARQQTPSSALNADPYPIESNGMNWWFVRVTWGGEAAAGYQELPTFADLAASTSATHINTAYAQQPGGRPDQIVVVPGARPLDEALRAILTQDPALRIALAEI
jgi:uncharacterized protein (DUF362 family)